MKYKNLVEYLNKNDDCYDALMDAVNKFIYGNKNNLDFSTDLIPNPYGYIKVEDATISSLHTEMLPQNYVLMHCNVYADIAIKGRAYGKWKSDVEEDCKTIWLTLKIKAKFVGVFSEFKIIDVRHIEDKDRYSIKNSANKNFIPYIRTEDLDSYATNFLLHYYPEALKTPMPLPVMKIVEKMGLKAVEAQFAAEGVFGQCYFKDREYSSKDGKKYVIPKGTIIYDTNAFFFNGIGTVENTIIHECIHWALHRRYFSLRHLLDPTLSVISCKVLDNGKLCNSQYQEDYYWMEWQANALAPRILMPAEMTRLKYKEIESEILLEGEKDTIKIYEEIIDRLSKFFKVSLTSAKIRLLELGYDDFKGIHNYVDNNRTPSYIYNKKNSKVKSNQTFSADSVDAIASILTNDKLRDCVEKKSVVYVNGFFVINSSRYVCRDEITKKLKLTDYAFTHMDECCLVFDNKRKEQWKDQCQFDDRYYSLCFLSRRQSNKKAYEGRVESNEYNDLRLDQSISLADLMYEYEEADPLVRKLGGTFGDNLTYLTTEVEEYKNSNVMLEVLTDINQHKIGNFLKGTTIPTKNEVYTIIASLELHFTVGERLLVSAGYSLQTTSQQDCFYKYCMHNHRDDGLEGWNNLAEELGRPEWVLPKPKKKQNKK
jgi:Zn-dependent peptidase ImmA (M78 family)